MTLVKADGTPLAKVPGSTVLQAVVDSDPRVPVQVDVYENVAYAGVNYPIQRHALKFRAGQVIRQSEWDNAFATPTVTAVSPATEAAAGGTAVTITGTGFAPDATVTFGGTAATSVVVKNPTTITCVTPAKTAGAYTVAVTTTGGTGSKTNAFTYS